MSFSVLQGFSKSLAMTVLSEIGDKTFFFAAMLAMHQPRRLVLAGCLAASIVMTILSALLGWAAPNLKSRQWTYYIGTLLWFGFGLWTLWEGFTAKGKDALAEVEAQLDDDLKSQRRPMLTQFFSPILLMAFSFTFFGEWGDKSQMVTIGLAVDENPLGVVLGGILGQALCTTAAVLGGRSLASQISESMAIHKFVFLGGILFLIFGIHSFLAARYILDTIPASAMF